MHDMLIGNDSTSVEEAHRIIDEAIERHQHSPSIQLKLKSERNTFAPMSRLPTEIFCKIFSIVKVIEPHGMYRIGGKVPLQWFKLTWVCRHWRNIAISSPSLWIDPLIGDLHCVEQMLLRSKNNRLIVQARIACLYSFLHGPKAALGHYLPGLKLALVHGQRVKKLSLYVNEEQWKRVQMSLPKTAPQLEFLELACSVSGKDPKTSLFGSEEVLSETPKLRCLELRNFELNWNTHSHLLYALTDLDLSHFSLNPRMTWKQFTNILKGMPDLQVLRLVDAFPAESGEPISWASTYLASLHTLFINCNTTQAKTFFSCITFPSTVVLKVECYAPSNTNADFSGVLMHLAQLYSNELDIYFQTLILVDNNHSGSSPALMFRLFADALQDEQMLVHDDITAIVECRFSWVSTSYSDAALSFAKNMNEFFSCGLPLRDINRVYLTEALYRLKPDTLANTVGQLGQVHTIITSNSAGRLLIDALQLGSYNEDTTSVSPFETPYFPNLSVIYFLSSRFRARYKRQIREDDPNYLPMELLNNCLIQRHSSGMGLSKLIFRRCRRMLKSDVILLQKTVGDVNWDGLRL